MAEAPPRRRRWILVTVTALVAIVVAIAAGVGWLYSDTGLTWALHQVPGLQITGMKGRPDRGSFSAERLQWQSATLTVTAHQLAWRELQWRWRPHPGAWVGITLTEPHAERVEVHTRPGPEPAQPSTGAPDHLHLPLELAVRGLQVRTVQVNELPPIDALAADLHLGDAAGALHRVHRVSARMAQRQMQAQLTLRSAGDMALAGHMTLESLPGGSHPLQARVELSGTLPRPELRAHVDAGAGAQLQAKATLAPFEHWPLVALEASTHDLDLSALANGLPGTRLTGTAVVQGDGRTQPMAVRLDLVNGSPGPWSALRLPVREVHAVIQGDPAALSKLNISTLDLQLQGHRPAGRVQGSGRWDDTALTLDLALAKVDAGQLHDAAAPATLSGPLQLRLDGLPSPTSAAPKTAAPGLTATLHTDLRGTLRRREVQAVQLLLDGALALPTDGSLHARELRGTLAVGPAQAKFEADVQRLAQGTWQGRSRGQLTRFDPSDWWAGPPDAKGWQRGPHALSGRWDAAFTAPPVALPPTAAAPPPWRDRLLALQADATVALRDSRLGGVPLRADVVLKAGDKRARLDADVRAADALAKAEFAIAADPQADRGQVDIEAPLLAALSPLFELIPGATAWAPRSGSLQAHAKAAGAWPALRTEGTLRAARIDGGSWRLGAADARWTAAPADPDAPLSLMLQATNLARGEQRLDRVQAEVDGSLRQHRMSLLATSPLRPPAWTDAALSQGQAPPRGGQLSVRGAGRWQPASTGGGIADGGEWRADIAELRAAPPVEGAEPWLLARGLQATLRLAPGGTLAQVSLAPNTVNMLGAQLRWQQARYDAPAAAGAPPRLEVDAQLDPLPVAPWLARLQPHMGWSGDLRVGGRIKATSAQGFNADVAIERQGGDLRLSDAAGPRALGLTDLHVAATARNGVWRLSESVKGGGLGELSGSQTLRTDPSAVLPGADAPLEGSLNLRVADLGVWSAWLPAGWRIGGRLQADAALAGQLGAPHYRGRVTGNGLAVANLLEGVQLTEGELALALDGERATLERLLFKGGDGTVRAEGNAQLGASPQAQLRVKAERLLALGRLDRRVVVSGDANMALRAAEIELDGRFTIDQGRIDISQADAPSLDEDVTVVQVNSKTAAKANGANGDASPPLLARADVQIALDLGQDLRLRGRGLDTLLKGRLRITTPGGALAVNGTLRTDDGTYTAYGQNLAIERGVINFSGDLATPRLDILAVRPDIDARVGVAIQGSAADPRVRLYSEPEMSEMDKLSWILTGREPDGMGRAETALLQRAALALLAGERGKPSDGGTLKKLGIDELSVARGDSGELSGTVVTLGKQLSKRWSVAYARGLNATAGSWQLIYRAARRFTLRAQSGEESAVDVIWTWRWN
jgi:translocation and assembly module TamB